MRLIGWLKYIILVLSIVGFCFVGALLGIGYADYKQAVETISVEEKVEMIREDPGFVTIEEVSNDFKHALIAVEDHRYYDHGPVDMIGLTRAMIVNVIQGEFVQGGSTITQQLAKNMYFSSEQTLIRKIAELFVAYDLERAYEKDQILELYMNIIYFGDGAYGIGEASKNFFNKEPGELTVEEAAMLAGLPQSPSRYAGDIGLAKKRQQIVLNAMEENGYLTLSIGR